MNTQDYILQLRNIDLRFRDHQVLKNISLDFERGKIHGLFGRNGAGKTVMLEMIAGVHHAQSGQIILDGKPVTLPDPLAAMKAGIGSVLQADTLVDDVTVGENLMMQEYALTKKQSLFFGAKKQRAACQAVLDRLGIHAKYNQKMNRMNYGTKQLIKLARTICSIQHYRLLIMDEPCSGCSAREEAIFHQLLHDLQEQGYTVIFTSHHIDQVLPYCDTITVIDDGQITMHCSAAETDYSSILFALSNGNIPKISYPTIPQAKNRVILDVANVSTERIDNVSFSLRKGEILGIAGLLGSGRTGIARALAGLDPLFKGTISINGNALPTTRDYRHDQISFLPSDHLSFLVSNFSIPPNITMSNLHEVQKVGVLDVDKEMRVGYHYTRILNIKEPQQRAQVAFLSAGNQKKVTLSRMLFKNNSILILDDPTENIDVLSKNEIYNQLNSYVLQGNAVIFISSDIQELKHLCSRILVTQNRTVIKEVSPAQLTYEDLFN